VTLQQLADKFNTVGNQAT